MTGEILILYAYTSSPDDHERLGFFVERYIKDDTGHAILNPTLSLLLKYSVNIIDRRDDRYPELQCEFFVKVKEFPKYVKKLYDEASGKLCELTVRTRPFNRGTHRMYAGVALDFVRLKTREDVSVGSCAPALGPPEC
jgi:hypothetical protein